MQTKLSTTQKVKAMADVTKITGILPEFICQQLKMYGLAFSSAVQSVEIAPDVDANTITFVCVVDPEKIEKDIAKRIEVLKTAVKALTQGNSRIHRPEDGQYAGWNAVVRFRRLGTTGGAE